MTKTSRQVVISGKDRFVPLNDQEKRAHLLYVWVAFTRSSSNGYFNFNWFKTQGLYARMTFWRDNFVIEEKLIKYANQLVYKESGPDLRSEIIRSCTAVNDAKRSADEFGYEFTRKLEELEAEPINTPAIAVVTAQLLYAAGVTNLLLGGDAEKFLQGPQAPYYWYKGFNGHGCLLEGIGYSCEDGVEGELTIHSYNEEWCFKPGTFTPIGRDETGRPPASSSDAPPAGGGGGGGSTTPPSGTAPPPPTGVPVPAGPDDPGGYKPPTGPNDGSPPGQSVACALYEIEITGTRFGGRTETSRRTVPGQVGGIRKVYGYNGLPPQYFGYFYTVGIGCPNATVEISTTFSGIDLPGGQNDGAPSIKIIRKL
jgi:hypothetical protein